MKRAIVVAAIRGDVVVPDIFAPLLLRKQPAAMGKQKQEQLHPNPHPHRQPHTHETATTTAGVTPDIRVNFWHRMVQYPLK